MANVARYYQSDDDRQYLSLFEQLDADRDGLVRTRDLKRVLSKAGFYQGKPMAGAIFAAIEEKTVITCDEFLAWDELSLELMGKVLHQDLVINKFELFTDKIADIYAKTKPIKDGEVATYIPQLARVDPDYYAVSVCTIDGQMYHIGDADVPFTAQSVSKAINYILALEEHSTEYVHSYVGEEPSGRGFNELAFNYKGLPFNPMTNAGGIMCCSLMHSHDQLASRLEYVINMWKEISGLSHVGFDAPTYLSELDSGNRNFALAYLMKEKEIFPASTDIIETLRFYFQCCSIQVDTDILAAVAATFAHGGISPVTEKRIVAAESVTNCLTLMYSCGLYDFSGEFSFYVGLPAKSGVSGCMMIVVPSVLGIGIYSPRVDRLGNSERAVAFCKELVRIFSFHNWDHVLKNPHKIDPCSNSW